MSLAKEKPLEPEDHDATCPNAIFGIWGRAWYDTDPYDCSCQAKLAVDSDCSINQSVFHIKTRSDGSTVENAQYNARTRK